MRYAVDFSNPKTGKEHTVIVQISDEEASICASQPNPDLHRRAYAIGRAFREAPKGFLPVQGSSRALH